MDGYSQHLDEQSTIKRESRGQSDVVFAPFHVSAVLCRLSLSVGMSFHHPVLWYFDVLRCAWVDWVGKGLERNRIGGGEIKGLSALSSDWLQNPALQDQSRLLSPSLTRMPLMLSSLPPLIFRYVLRYYPIVLSSSRARSQNNGPVRSPSHEHWRPRLPG